MPYVDCPRCGKPGAAYEDANGETFCGACEEEYRRYELALEAESKARLKRKCETCSCHGDCDWGLECPIAVSLINLR